MQDLLKSNAAGFEAESTAPRLRNILRNRRHNRKSRTPETVPSLVECPEAVAATGNDWSGPYEPTPVISQSTILLLGAILFVIASYWPPLLLLVAYVVSKIIPYSFRSNDDAVTRRTLFAEFTRQEDLPESFKSVPKSIQLEESYWVNNR